MKDDCFLWINFYMFLRFEDRFYAPASVSWRPKSLWNSPAYPGWTRRFGLCDDARGRWTWPFGSLVLWRWDSRWVEGYLFDIFFDFLLVEIKDLGVLKLIFLIIFKLTAIFIHKFLLNSLKLFFSNDFLKCSYDTIKEDIFWRWWMVCTR